MEAGTPMLKQHGTDEQKARLLPPILRGELHFAIGYSEPGAGTDLASIMKTAPRIDEYRSQSRFTATKSSKLVTAQKPGPSVSRCQ